MFTITSLPFLVTVVGRGLRGRAGAPARYPQSCPPSWNLGNRGFLWVLWCDACTADSRELQPESIKYMNPQCLIHTTLTYVFIFIIIITPHLHYSLHISTLTLFCAATWNVHWISLILSECGTGSTLTSVILFMAYFKLIFKTKCTEMSAETALVPQCVHHYSGMMQ